MIGLTGIVRILFHSRGQLFHAGSSFFQIGSLFFGTLREIRIAISNFFRCGGNQSGGILDLSDDIGQLSHGEVGVIFHGGKHALVFTGNFLGQIAISQSIHDADDILQTGFAGLH